MPMHEKKSALGGIRVIDFGHYTAGPLTGMLLADQGAEVIKIERPGSAASRSPADAAMNRGKKRLELNLKQPEDLAKARKLVLSADVLIENFRPGVMQRLGLGAQAVTAANPGLVYLSLPGFAASDQERAAIRAFEGVVGAAVGLYTDLQVLPRLLGAPPVYTPIALGSTYGAIHGAIAAVLALYAREESGLGDVIEVPLVGAAMSAMAIINLVVENAPERYALHGMAPFTPEEHTKLPEWRQQVQEKGKKALAEISKNLGGLGIRGPATGTYLAGDGKWIYHIAGGHSRNTRDLLMAYGIHDELLADGMVDLPVYENFDKDNNLPESFGWSRSWNLKVQDRLKQIIAQKPAAYWVDRLTAAGVPAGIHLSAANWLQTAEAATAALTVEIDDPDFGRVRQPGVQTWLAGTDDEFMQPAPVHDVDIERLFVNAMQGVSGQPCEPPEKVRKLNGSATNGSSKQILHGVRVLDLSNVLAGPASARTLAEYGADVIKIDPTDPKFGPKIACYFPIEVSPGKRSIILDLKVSEGRDIFYELVKTADIVVHNFRPGVANRLGIDYEKLQALNPGLIYVNLTAFNGPRPGPWMQRPGFDPLLQATTGIQMRYGGEGKQPLPHGWASCVDYIAGYSASLGTALALFQRRRTPEHRGEFVTTSLAQGAQLVQMPWMVATDTLHPGSEPQGQDAIGERALNRIYRATDGWLFLAGLPSEKNRLQELDHLREVPVSAWEDDQQLAAALEVCFRTRPVDFWVSHLHQAGFGAHRVDSLVEIAEKFRRTGTTAELQDSWDDGRSISWVRFTDHPVGGAVELAPPAYARFQRAHIKLLSPAPKQGHHTRELLKELGYSDTKISHWLQEGVVKEQLHQEYLPG